MHLRRITIFGGRLEGPKTTIIFAFSVHSVYTDVHGVRRRCPVCRRLQRKSPCVTAYLRGIKRNATLYPAGRNRTPPGLPGVQCRVEAIAMNRKDEAHLDAALDWAMNRTPVRVCRNPSCGMPYTGLTAPTLCPHCGREYVCDPRGIGSPMPWAEGRQWAPVYCLVVAGERQL